MGLDAPLAASAVNYLDTPGEFAAYIAADVQKWKELLSKIGKTD